MGIKILFSGLIASCIPQVHNQDCTVSVKVVYYINIDIRDSNNYPINESIILENFSYESLNTKKDLSEIFNYLTKNFFYTPNSQVEYSNDAACYTDSALTGIKSDKNIISIINFSLLKKTRKSRITFKTGQVLTVSAVKLSGHFIQKSLSDSKKKLLKNELYFVDSIPQKIECIPLSDVKIYTLK